MSTHAVDVATVDPITLAYMEQITSHKGQRAVDQYLRYTGWRETRVVQRGIPIIKRTHLPIERLMAKAQANARALPAIGRYF